MTPVLYLVVPCYNEEAVLPVTSGLFLQELQTLADQGRISQKSRILFVDDGSEDGTWEIVTRLAGEDPRFTGISLSRNRGHQNAVLAGLMEARDKADAVISVDCDGQDDIKAMGRMIDEFAAGAEVVYGVRSARKSDTFFKRFTAESYYRILRAMGVEVVFNHADYRLASSRVLRALEGFGEVNLFLRGIFPQVGFRSAVVEYDRQERLAGESRYPLPKMLALAAEGITSFSVKPLRFLLFLGALFFLCGLISLAAGVFRFLALGIQPLWTLFFTAVLLLGGLQLLCAGILGEYLGKIYLETKRRPRYIIRKRTGEGIKQ